MSNPHIIDYNTIDIDKENIKPISQGRSANKLSEIINTNSIILKSQLDNKRIEFENSLNHNILQDLDDPLDNYLKYIKWIRENYRTGNTHESLLIQVLERTTHDFKDDDYYKNEIRYFKVWLEYITYSDHPGDVFNYLFKKKIGCDLSLFYENYSLFFELNDQWDKAEEILKLGISNKARPLTRLLKSFDEFLLRKSTKSIPIKLPLHGLSNPNGNGLESSSLANNNNNNKEVNALKKKNKIQIFNDNTMKSNNLTNPIFNNNIDHDHDNNNNKNLYLDTVQHSKKENVIKPVFWKGETLKNSAKENEKNSKKIKVFNDRENQYPITKTVKRQNGDTEILDFNLDLFLPQNNTPMTMIEVLLKFQEMKKQFVKPNVNITNKEEKIKIEHDLNQSKIETQKRQVHETEDLFFNTPKKLKLTLDDLADMDENFDSNTKTSQKITDTPILEYFKSAKDGLFSEEHNHNNNNNNNNNNNIDGDKIDTNNTTRHNKSDTPIKSNQDNLNELAEEINASQHNLLDDIIGGAFSDIFTDTLTKPLEPKTPLKEDQSENNDNVESDNFLSSPFVENPSETELPPSLPKNITSPFNPFDSKSKLQNHDIIEKRIFENYNIHKFESITMNKLPILKKLFKPNSAPLFGNKQALLEFEKNDIHCVTKELGRGGYAIVYLSEKMDGELNALKVESQPNLWEIYILSSLNKKSNQFMELKSAYIYKDESYLILPYFKQGTILDLINTLSNHQYLTGKNLLEESLIIYFSIQLINKILVLHSLGFIHCDIKPDNFMLNINNIENKVKFNDLILIDFGRSIDLSLYPKNALFQCKFEKTDSQDCPQFVNNLPWLFEPDYYGIANVIHMLLFNKAIKVQQTEEGYRITEAFKRYWQQDLWNEIFDMLLNPKKYNSSSNIYQELGKVKNKLESWFNLTIDKRIFLEKLRQINDLLISRFKKSK